MKKNTGYSPSAYQTISKFCEESTFDSEDDDSSVARPESARHAIVKLLALVPWRRKQTDIPG